MVSGRYRHRSSLSRPQKSDTSFEKFSKCIGFCLFLFFSPIKIHFYEGSDFEYFIHCFIPTIKTRLLKMFDEFKKILSKKSKHNIGIFKISNLRAGEMVHGSRPLAALAANPSSVHCTYTMVHNHPYFQFQVTGCLLSLPVAPGLYRLHKHIGQKKKKSYTENKSLKRGFKNN